MNKRLSASKINSLEQCSYKFYCNYFLKLPETTHPKTIIGTVCHEFLEKINVDPELWDKVKQAGFRVEKVPEALDIVDSLAKLHNAELELCEPIPDMLELGLRYLEDLESTGYTKKMEPETKFHIKEKDYEIIGFIDQLYLYKDKALIVDYKTKGQRFKKSEMDFNVQALIYQLAVWQEFGLKADVDFIMLRHPPTKRTPLKHIQSVEFVGEETLNGLKEYLSYLSSHLEDFNLIDACSNFLADKKNQTFFCWKICQFQRAFDYFAIVDENGRVKQTSKEITELRELEDGETLELKHYAGCPKFRNLK